MTTLFSNPFSDTKSTTDSLPSTSSRPRKVLLLKPIEPTHPLPLQKRKTLKLKGNFYDENSNKSLQSLQNDKETKKTSSTMNMKRRLVGVIEDMGKAKYKPKNDQGFYQAKVRLFDTQKKVNFMFRCFKEEELGYKDEITKMLVGTKQDNDVETDDETLKYYVGKCQKDLDEAVKMERKRKEGAKK